jgi:hypothetical protein
MQQAPALGNRPTKTSPGNVSSAKKHEKQDIEVQFADAWNEPT